jgi:Family of unknown function (DUF6069)
MSANVQAASAVRQRPAGLWRRRLLIVVAAVVAAAVVWVIAVPIAGVDLRSPETPSFPTRPITLPLVLVMAAWPPLAAWALLAILERVTSRARTIWLIVAFVVLVLSFYGPFAGTGVGSDVRITLASMHVVVAAVTIPLLYRSSAPRVSR